MQVLIYVGVLLASYLFGAIPFGLLIVKALTGKDIRTVESGRTGGTNAMRAAGLGAGLLTAILDVLKSGATVLLAAIVAPSVHWLHPLAPFCAVLGHNHSIFLLERRLDGKLRLRGGAGGAAALGGTLALWPPAALIMLPVGLFIWFVIGYASLTTLSIGLMTIVIFGVRAALGLGPWADVTYGMAVEFLMVWTLRPNLKRLVEGTERRHGLPAFLERRKKDRQAQGPEDE
jgi:glycerol-3-phosphate acyltransferase PlsY